MDSLIVGPWAVDHLDEQVTAPSVVLPQEDIDRLEASKTPVWSYDIGDVE